MPRALSRTKQRVARQQLEQQAAREQLEQRAAREQLHGLTVHDYHHQIQSPLFGILPGEIRNKIVDYALAEYEDMSRPYRQHNHYYRPGHRAPRRTDTALLRTCKLIYLEARHLPLDNATFSFWYESTERCPPGKCRVKMADVFRTIPGGKLNTIHAFSQLYWLENDGLNSSFKFPIGPPILPRRLVITVRHGDWWYWETDTPLHIDGGWVTRWRLPPTVKEVVVEFETPQRKKAQLDALVPDLMREWTFEREDGVKLSAEGSRPAVSNWTGSAIFDGVNHEPVVNSSNEICSGPQPLQIVYCVQTVTWRPLANMDTKMSQEGN